MFSEAEFRSTLLESQLLREAALQARLRSEEARRGLRNARAKIDDESHLRNCDKVKDMTPTILSLSRRHVLGDIYSRCDEIQGDIPVYLDDESAPVMIGYANQSLGHFADAFSFHLDAGDCKKLSSGQFSFSVTYEFSNEGKSGRGDAVKLTSITLTGRKSYENPAPKNLAIMDII